MIRAALGWLAGRVRREDDEREEGDDSRFVPSALDASVRYAHGMSDSSVERELTEVENRAETLEEQHRDTRDSRRDG